MLPQGSALINTEFFTELERRAGAVQTCAELQAFTEEALGSLNASLAAINQQMALLAPILALLTAPGADPSKIVTWIKDFIAAFLTPYVKPYTTYVAQLAALAAAIAELSATLQARATHFDACDLSIPMPVPPPSLPDDL